MDGTESGWSGRSEEEKMKLEEARLMRMLSGNLPNAEIITTKETSQKRIERLPSDAAAKVLQAQKFLQDKQKKTESSSLSSMHVETGGISSIPNNSKERRLVSFFLKGAPSNGKKIQLNIEHTLELAKIIPVPSCFDEKVTVLINGNGVQFEAKHSEKFEENGNEVIEKVRYVQDITFPFVPELKDISFKPSESAIYMEIVKPSF